MKGNICEAVSWPLEPILEAIQEGITIRDAAGRLLGSNRTARALGVEGEDTRFVGQDGAALAPAEHPAMIALASGNPVAALVGLERRDQPLTWLHVHSVPTTHPYFGRVVVSSFSEAGHMVEAQRRLAESERRYRAIFDHTYEFIGLLDVHGRLIDANATALAFIDAGLDELAGRPFADTPWWAHSADERAKLIEGIGRAAQGEFVRFETSHPLPDGTAITIDFSLKPVHGSDGRVIYIIPEGRDISEFKRTEQALRAAKLEAEAASRAKSTFLAAVSHELRTPLNAVIGFSETMLAGIFGALDNPRHSEYVALIHDAGSHLRDVIEDILDVARIETGDVTLHEEEMDLRDCLAGSLRFVGQRADQRSIALNLEAPDQLPRLKADPLRIRQIVLNLLSNAIKFTPPGGTATLKAAIGARGLELAVSDSGIGIQPQDLEHIWKPFFQVDTSLSRRFEGTGLGLPIVRHYVQAHGGRIEVDSHPGRGTTFTVTLPAERLVA